MMVSCPRINIWIGWSFFRVLPEKCNFDDFWHGHHFWNNYSSNRMHNHNFEIKKMTFSDFKGMLILLKKNKQKKVLVTVVKFQMNFHVHHFKKVYFFTIFDHFMSLLWFKIKNLTVNINFFRKKKKWKFKINFKKNPKKNKQNVIVTALGSTTCSWGIVFFQKWNSHFFSIKGFLTLPIQMLNLRHETIISA